MISTTDNIVGIPKEKVENSIRDPFYTPSNTICHILKPEKPWSSEKVSNKKKTLTQVKLPMLIYLLA